MMKSRCAAIVVSIASVMTVGALPGASAAAATHTIAMEGVAFVPASLTVKRGDTVVWVNKDMFAHTATADDRSFDSKDIAARKTWKHVAGKSGTFAYVCTLHPTMKGTLIVK
jgi:plastocyanin